MDKTTLSPDQFQNIADVVSAFHVEGDLQAIVPYGTGHINDTYAVSISLGGTPVRYLLQRVNHEIFKDVPGLMDNVDRVCSHLQKRLKAEGAEDASRRSLHLIQTRTDMPYYLDDNGLYWRMYIFIEGASGHDVIQNERQAYLAARAFAEFQAQLVDLPGERLSESIPDFHHTPKRFAHLKKMIAEDPCGRAASAAAEIEWFLAHAEMADTLIDLKDAGKIPERVTHNDTKLNNILIDDKTDEAMCVIDLDTIMPGLSLYDFGDLVRTSTSPVADDEKDPSKVTMQLPMYRALVEGFLSAGHAYLNETEIEHLAASACTITFECGSRFLSDYLAGDTYFKTKYDDHNLVRCRTQIALIQSMIDQQDDMSACAADALKGV